MLPYKFSLPFLSLSLHNKRTKACFQSERTGTKTDTQEGTDFAFSLSCGGGFAQVRFQETQSSNSPVFIHYRRGGEDLGRGGRDKGVQEMNKSRGATEALCDSAAIMKRSKLARTVADTLLYPDGPHAAPWVSRHCWVSIVHMLLSFFSGQTSSKKYEAVTQQAIRPRKIPVNFDH